jgi:hypothetical protein
MRFVSMVTAGALLATTILAGTAQAQGDRPAPAGKPVQGEEFSVANGSTARVVGWAGGRLVTKSVENLITRQKYPLEGEEFAIRIDGVKEAVTAATAKVKGAQVAQIPGGKRLVVSLTDAALAGAELRVVYELKESDFYGRKWIEIDPAEGKNIPVASIAVESLKFPATAKCEFPGGTGQPVYIEDVFLGLEWPLAANSFRQGGYSATHCPAWDAGQGFRSKSAVWGAAPAGEVSHWFIEKYLPAIRVTPPPPLRLLHDTYGGGDVHQAIAGYRDNLLKKHGVPLGNLELFGWEKKPSIFEERTPGLLEGLHKTLQSEIPGCHLGLYWPFSNTEWDGNYPKWSTPLGYELTGEGGYCMVGSNFAKKAREQLRHYITDLGVTFLMDDNYKFGTCNVAGHGHRTAGGAARESQMEGNCRFARFVKDVNPKVVAMHWLDPGCQSSPWLLAAGFDGDLLECGVGAEGLSAAGVGFRRERWINAWDGGVYATCVGNGRQFPPNSIASVALFREPNCGFGAKDDGQAWEHDVLMAAARGAKLWFVRISATTATAEQWAFLAKTFKWAGANAGVLDNNTRFLPGKVAADEPYGYSHSKGDRCLVFLRNPSLPGALTLKGWRALPVAKDKDLGKDYAAPGFDDGGWEKVDDPSKFDPKVKDESVLYRCRFDVPAEWKGKPIYLFGISSPVASQKNEAFVNGKAVTSDVAGPNGGGNVSEAIVAGGNNTLAVRMNKNRDWTWNKVGRPVMLACLDQERCVPFTLDPAVSGFDPKYKHASATWIYPEGRAQPKELEVGKAVNFAMKAFDVLVFELKLTE